MLTEGIFNVKFENFSTGKGTAALPVGGDFTFTKKIKIRMPRIPENAKIMSLMALILICAAPALVSVIDDQINDEYAAEVALDDTGAYAVYDMGLISVSAPGDVAAVLPSDAGSWMISAIDSTVVPTITAYRMYYTATAFETADPSIINVDVAGTPKAVTLRMVYDGGAVTLPMTSDNGIYSVTLSSVDKILLATSNITTVMFFVTYEAGTAPAVFTADVTAFTVGTVPYAEIIVGATGALLLICAIFATPWFGMGGYTGSKPKRRGA